MIALKLSVLNDVFSGNYPSVETNIDGKVVPVCQAFEYGKYLGHIDIKFTKENGRYVINQRSDFSVSSWFFNKNFLLILEDIFILGETIPS